MPVPRDITYMTRTHKCVIHHSAFKMKVRERGEGAVLAGNVFEHEKSQTKGHHNPQRPAHLS